ncbi:hypothetical protein Taro_034685, partial [Colocasia esculenta]|nr:hypothetical protein [Colocasia esculenta]
TQPRYGAALNYKKGEKPPALPHLKGVGLDVQLYTRVRVSRKTTQTSMIQKYRDKPRALTCLAHTKSGAPN